MKRTIYKILAFLYPPNLGKTVGVWIENLARAIVFPFESLSKFFKIKSNKKGFLQRTTTFLQPHIIDFDFDPFGASWFALTLYLMLFNLSLPILFGVGILDQGFFVRYLSSPLQYTIPLSFSYIIRHTNVISWSKILERIKDTAEKWRYIWIELAKICFVLFFSGVIGYMFFNIADL